MGTVFKSAIKHHMGRRLNGWDYSGRGVYMVTITIEERRPLMGRLVKSGDSAWSVEPSKAGRMVEECLGEIPVQWPGVSVMCSQLMPDHLHFIVSVEKPQPKPLGAIVGSLKAKSTSRWLAANGQPQTARFWASGYVDLVLLRRGQLAKMVAYLKDNPRRLWIKNHNPELFRLHRRTEAAGLSFTSMGNHFLLDWPDKQVVEMSRSATNEEVQERLRIVLAAAHNGTVTYTAAISKGEQLIARTLREQGYPLVVLLNDGFPKEGTPHERYYKPGGVYFEACSRGQLLLLEPTEQTFFDADIQAAVEETLRRKAEARHYAYTPIPLTAQRYRFVELNEMAKRLLQK